MSDRPKAKPDWLAQPRDPSLPHHVEPPSCGKMFEHKPGMPVACILPVGHEDRCASIGAWLFRLRDGPELAAAEPKQVVGMRPVPDVIVPEWMVQCAAQIVDEYAAPIKPWHRNVLAKAIANALHDAWLKGRGVLK